MKIFCKCTNAFKPFKSNGKYLFVKVKPKYYRIYNPEIGIFMFCDKATFCANFQQIKHKDELQGTKSVVSEKAPTFLHMTAELLQGAVCHCCIETATRLLHLICMI